MTAADIASLVLAAILSMEAAIAIRFALILFGIATAFWLVTPHYIRQNIQAELDEEREQGERRRTGWR